MTTSRGHGINAILHVVVPTCIDCPDGFKSNFAGALTKTAINLTNGPGGVPEGVANFVDTNSYQNGHFVRG